MYQDTKEKLQHSFDSVAPDLLSEIMSAEIHKIASEEELFSELNEKSVPSHHMIVHKLYRYASVAAIFICVLTLFFYRTQSVEGTVTVECGHSTTLSLNHAGKIVRIDSDDSSQKMLELCKIIKGKCLEEGLQKVLKESKQDKNTVCITYKGKKKTDKNRKVIDDVSKRFTKDSGKDVVSKEQSVGSASEEIMDLDKNNEQKPSMEETEHSTLIEDQEETLVSEKEVVEEPATVSDDMTEEAESDTEDENQEEEFTSQDEIQEEVILPEESVEEISEDSPAIEEESPVIEEEETTLGKAEMVPSGEVVSSEDNMEK